MVRNIFIVNAAVVDANGNYNVLSGYPKNFDSKNYNNDIDKTLKRAQGEMSEVWSAFCKRDDRQMQVVTLSMANGRQIDYKCDGHIYDLPDPEPEPEPEEEPEPEGE